MNDQIEPAIEASTEMQVSFDIGKTGTAVIFALATYGASKLTQDATSLVKKIRTNRKAKKAAEQAASDSTEK